MDWSLILLLTAVAVTWLFWRRARAQVAAARAAADAATLINTFELEPFDDGGMRGFHVVDMDGARVDVERLNWLEQGLDVLDVDDVAQFDDAASQRAFAPGVAVELIADDTPPDAPVSVSVWDETMTLRCGPVRPNQAPALLFRLDREEVGSCVVLRETRAAGRPVHLLLLLVHRDVDVGIATSD